MSEPFDRPEVVAAADAWASSGRWVDAGGRQVWCARFPAVTDAGNPPLLVLHGFPTCSYDWKPVLPALRAQRDVVVLDVTGFGLSDKPDHRYSIRTYADDVEAVIAAEGLTEVDLITHDMGDTVGGEFLARTLEGSLALQIRRRVVTNGSIYIDMAQLTLGQQVLLGLPDEANEVVATDGGTAYRAGFVGTFAPDTPIGDATELDLDVTVHLAVRAGGLVLLPRTIRYIEDRRAEERRFTGAVETHPSPVGIVWGELDPVAVHAMAEVLVAACPGTPLITLDGVGHYPMIEAPERFASAVLDLLDHGLV
ncbi:alpha/beta fold hydrolase [Aquihabitans daechungensis]|uniref:alpha/beta fold hydrolase n=1 Tax=Aquihabitans daechungensis TaxID=1052257 RepID=UPI003BA3ACBC